MHAYSRNRAIGMCYFNRFLIEEDAHFECCCPLDHGSPDETAEASQVYRKRRHELEALEKITSIQNYGNLQNKSGVCSDFFTAKVHRFRDEESFVRLISENINRIRPSYNSWWF